MSQHEKHERETEQSAETRCRCPMCQMKQALGSGRGLGKPFWDHLTNARIEVLRAVRSLIDERIDHLEKKKAGKSGEKKATPIAVE